VPFYRAGRALEAVYPKRFPISNESSYVDANSRYLV